MFSLAFNFFVGRNILIYKIKSIRSYSRIQDIVMNMPRSGPHIKQAKISYEKRKKKIGKYSAKSAIITVIGSGATATPRVVSLRNESTRYMFNCGEGIQRICSEWKTKISRHPHVFITYPSWKNIAGLLGYCLSMESLGIPELFIYGHPSIELMFIATQKFVNLNNLKVTVVECDPDKNFSDGIFNIKFVTLYPNNSHNLNKCYSDSVVPESEKNESQVVSCESADESMDEKSNDEDVADYYSYLRRSRFKTQVITKTNRPNRRSQSEAVKVPSQEGEKYALSFICQSPIIPGKLLIEKCVELGIKPGPVLGKLKNGEDIELDNGKIISGSNLTTSDIPGAYIIVLECPTEEYLDSLLREPAFFKHQTGDVNPNDIAELVVHFSNSDIMKHPKYQEWMNRFPEQTKHLIVNDENVSMGSWGVYEHQYFLNKVHPEIFPLLYPTSPPFPTEHNILYKEHTVVSKFPVDPIENNQNNPENVVEEQNGEPIEKIYYKCNSSFIKGETLSEVYIRPKRHYDFSHITPFSVDNVMKKFNNIKGLKEELEKLRNEVIKKEASIKLDKREYPKILFLGTGSSMPCKKRNTSGILVFLDEDNAMIFDCGEGTYCQLVRFYGKDNVREVLQKIKIVYISHLHADHHTGLITFLKERKAKLDEVNNSDSAVKYEKISIFAPYYLNQWLKFFSDKIEPINHLYDFFGHKRKGKKELVDSVEKIQVLKDSNLKILNTTLVDHCPNAFGVTITHNDGWKLTYSGDTRPCKNLVELGKDSDILIHEATLCDSLELQAAHKLHSTVSQAIAVGKEMNAKFILLTHFSQRFSHLPFVPTNVDANVGLAFDNMMVSMRQLPLLSLFYGALRTMFSDKLEKLEFKISELENKKRKISFSSDIPSKIADKLP